MVEIFTVSGGQQGDATRAVSNDIRLSGPSDVYFGAAAAGIAYYEKSGSDLRVTLLDGQEVMVRNFFVIGADGEYSRLLDGGAGGEVEVTGLIAPEPFIPSEAVVPAVAAVEDEKPVEVAPTGALAGGEEIVAVSVDGEAPAGGGGAAVGTFGGMSLDRAFFGAAMMPVMVTMIRGGGDDDATPVPVPQAQAAAVQETVAEASADTPMEADTALLLVSIYDDAAPADTASEAAGFAPEAAADSSLTDFIASGFDLTSALLDDLAILAIDG
ncbi:BapA/Bap/LapF family prefix-like domain-containing protein [Pseudogemmobacter humi]|uniref:Biofilm-associated protein BapA-like prefix-like domain-containing protein n=1 Tax=Pseudogemmobacter humi TaxID=2483812 RepID=A0A3P5WZX1_9RHOB|nr:hypothetical protein [Pseudogemmobacter humi]VDC21159.1 hypothetical protein XINFAN_00523 [Pseudogemmobacter humi]